MPELPLYQVDAFTTEPFAGNPAAVVPLERWLDDELMQAIAVENNLSETAFFVPEGEGFRLRWFTPAYEVKLCGHATLASAFVVLEVLEPGRQEVLFHSKSGPLSVTREGARLAMTFPRRRTETIPGPPGLDEALGLPVQEVRRAEEDTLVVLADETAVRACAPDMRFIVEHCDRALMVTAAADAAEVDFVSRFFAPGAGVPEDPVTGSAHCALAPYWSERLGKSSLAARQLSARGGAVDCEVRPEAVVLKGSAVMTLRGQLLL